MDCSLFKAALLLIRLLSQFQCLIPWSNSSSVAVLS